ERARKRLVKRAAPYASLSLALDYPTAELDAALAAADGSALEPFLRFVRETPLAERQRRYVETFDLDRRATLHLTYYLLGDTRKRGLALLRLKRLYAAAGLPLDSDELPDYLPALLEFATLAPDGYGATLLGEHRLALELLRLRLAELESPWACLLERLCASLPRLLGPERDRLARLLAEGPPGEKVGLEPFAPPEVMPTGAHA
ncbi:MAG TPA: nitrate reductase molybdenum cofactor assembly chaperone, partial [Gaiellaceae bacterium]|nr:nitrate reductase molybdenum cofactor assembly chaperone [Gaiellaceae bacterium]